MLGYLEGFFHVSSARYYLLHYEGKAFGKLGYSMVKCYGG